MKLNYTLLGICIIVHLHRYESLSCHCDYSEEDDIQEILNGNACRPSGSSGTSHASSELKLENLALNLHPSQKEDMAMVVYTPTHLSEFRQGTKTFTFAGRSITIRQRWEELGVAAVVWDAAVVLAEHLEKSISEDRLSLSGKSVIELGAGTGLVGIVAALLGGSVVMTDRQVALDQLRANMEENLPKSGGRSGMITVKELSWGENLQEFSKPFDLIIGADIVYIEDTFPKLLQTMVHLSCRNTVVLLSCRIRYARDEKYLEMMREQFSVREIVYDRSRDIHVYEAQLL